MRVENPVVRHDRACFTHDRHVRAEEVRVQHGQILEVVDDTGITVARRRLNSAKARRVVHHVRYQSALYFLESKSMG